MASVNDLLCIIIYIYHGTAEKEWTMYGSHKTNILTKNKNSTLQNSRPLPCTHPIQNTMTLIYQSYLSFQTPMYTWKSAPTTTAATLVIPSSTTPEKTTTTVEEQQDPVIHDLCLQFYRSMLITTISNTTNINPEIDELCHSFRFMYVHDDDKDDQ